MDSIERRSIPADIRIEQRSGSKRTLTGHAAIFNSLSVDLGGFQEKVSSAAFAETIKTDDIRALIDHNPSLIIGRNRAGTLRLEEDRKGLRFEVDLGDTTTARDLATSVERGDISQNSFAFRVLPDG
jgi:uncharacterized protein